MDVSQQRETQRLCRLPMMKGSWASVNLSSWKKYEEQGKRKKLGLLSSPLPLLLSSTLFFLFSHLHACTHTHVFCCFFAIMVNPRHFFRYLCSLHKYNQSHELKTVFSKPIKSKIHQTFISEGLTELKKYFYTTVSSVNLLTVLTLLSLVILVL